MTDVIDLLTERGIEYRKTNNPSEIMIRCTSGNHNDKNPSLAFNLDNNIFKCFSCGFQGGIIKFLESIGITQKINIESKQEYQIVKLKRKLRKLQNVDNIKLPKNINKVVWDFNGIGKETFSEFNAFTTTEYDLDEYICVPVYQFGRLKFIEGRIRSASSKKPKYFRRPQGAPAGEVLFPIDKIDKTNHIILVEGMYDMLNLWQHGVRNSLCIFGAQNFGKKKLELLEKVGITKVSLFLDGDPAGRVAANNIQDLLDKQDIITNKIILEEGTDPGALNSEQIQYYLNRQ